MLIAKINPPAVTTKQNTPFSQPEIIVADRMRAFAERYDLGGSSVRFSVLFGYLVPYGIDTFQFKRVHQETVSFMHEEISDWGTDDSYIFQKISEKVGTSIVSIEEVNITNEF